MEKKVIARKKYICNQCDGPINKGDSYLFGKGRWPKYNDECQQIGIQYYHFRICHHCVDLAEKEEQNLITIGLS